MSDTRFKLAEAVMLMIRAEADRDAGYLNGVTDDDCDNAAQAVLELATQLVNEPVPEPPLLICVDCKRTESCAGAMARYFNQGRCLGCGGYFKVVRA